MKDEVARIIREAFAGVTLGDGVGLWWAQVLDDYEIPSSIADYRANHEQKEERLDWSRIPVEDLQRNHDSPSFFDAEGMRFHLPAFMLFELYGEPTLSVFYTMYHYENDYGKTQFSLLDKKQRAAVRAFLLYCKDLPDNEFDRPQIERALNEYWVEEK